MKRLVTLVRAGLRSNFGVALLKHRLLVERKDLWLVPVVALSALGAFPLLYVLIVFIHDAYLALEAVGQQRALLTLGIVTGQLFILLFGVYYVISAFYFSRDLEFLIPLPLRPYEVVASKFTVILVNEYLTVSAIVAPILGVYGVMAGGGPGYWVTALLVYLLLPVIPLALVSVLAVALMRFVNIGRKKDLLILAGSLLLISLLLGLQLLLARAEEAGRNTTAIASFLSSPDSLHNLVGSRFPPSLWAANAVNGGFSATGLLNLAMFAGTSLALFAALIAVSERIFYRGLVGLAEVSGGSRTLARDELSRKVSSGRHPVRAIFAREWRIMNRTPVFLLNGTLVVFMVPAIFVLMVKAAPGSGDVSTMLRMLASSNRLVVILSLAALMIACGSVNGVSSSAFSREGALFWISRVIPAAPREQVAAKFLHSYLVSLFGTVAGGAAAWWVLSLQPIDVAAAAGLSALAGLLLTAVGMMIDLARPLLDWTNPQKAIKQNLNVLLGLLAHMGIVAAFYLAVRAMLRAGVAQGTILAALYASLVVLSGMSYVALVSFADRRYREIET